jgi:hypothetical protein
MTNRYAIAARLRALFERTNLDVAMGAARLAVAESALRRSLDAVSPLQTLDVLIAVTRFFGLDPCWLITGEYSAACHARFFAADEEGRDGEVRRLVADLVERGVDSAVVSRVQHADTSSLT